MPQPWTFPHLIKLESDYVQACQLMYGWMQREDIVPDTPDGDNFEHLALLIEDYEARHHPIPKAEPLDAIQYYLEQSGLSEGDLSKILGGRSRKSEIMNGTRKLSLKMIRALHEKLHIPAEILIRAY